MEVWKYSLRGSINIELLECPGFCEEDEASNEHLSYSVSDMVRVAKEIRRKLKVREKLLENGWK